MDPNYPTRGSSAGLALCGNEHRCTVFCDISHEFGNIYRCKTSGRCHVCDSTCDQRCMYGKDCTKCLLSGKIHPASTELLSRLCRKRRPDEPGADEPVHKRSNFLEGRGMGSNGGRINRYFVAFRTPEGTARM